MVRRSLICALLGFAAAAAPSTLHAQAFRLGETFNLGGTTAPVEQPDVAHDSTNNRYLQVAGKVFIEANLLNAAGTILRTFRVSASGLYAQNPRVTFSPHIGGGVGGYLVTWHASYGDTARVVGRIFNGAGDAVTGEFEIATSATVPSLSTQWTMGAPAAYATGSQEFLVVFGGNKYTTYDILAQRVSTTGTLIGNNFLISRGGSDLYDRDPSVAYNPAADLFVVGWGVYNEAGRFGYSSTRSVRAGSGALGTIIDHGSAVGVSITSIAYNPTANQFLFAWHNQTRSGQFHYGVMLDGSGNPASEIRVMSGYYAAYDALDVEFNSVAGQYFLITHGHNHEDAGVTITGAGHPYDNGFLVTSTTNVNGNFHPRLATSASSPQWLVVTSSMFARTVGQFVTTSAVNSGPVTPPTPPPPTPAACAYTLSTSGEAFGQFGGGAGFWLTTGATCTWTATSSANWLTLGSSSRNGTGGERITFTVPTNTSRQARSAVITVAGKTVNVTQAGRTFKLTDFNHDGRNDILWQHQTTGELYVWHMSGVNLIDGANLAPQAVPDTRWKIVGNFDANQDGHSDLLWQHNTGAVAIWLMSGETQIGSAQVGSTAVDPRWRITGTGDMDNDGYDDILWQHADGTVAVWYLQGTRLRRGETITSMADARWRMVGAEDFDRDGRLDFLWQHSATGDVAIWRMRDKAMLEGSLVGFAVRDTDWQIQATSDLNGDAKPDLIWRNVRTGDLAAWLMDGLRFSVENGVSLNPGRVADVNWRIVGPR